jgi:uncharacterized membrane protein YfcA
VVSSLFLACFSIGVGVTCGALSGFFGIGGGALVLPSLIWYYHLALPAQETTYVAFSTSLAVTSISSLFSAYFGLKEGRLDSGYLKQLALPAAIGAFAGALVGLTTKPAILKVLTGLMLLYLAQKLLKRAAKKLTPPAHSPESKRRGSWLAGLVAGCIYSLAGAGGASVLTLHLIKNGLNAKQAITTTSAVVGLIGIAAVLGFGDAGKYLTNQQGLGSLDWLMLAIFAPSVLVGSWSGNRASQLVDATQLRKYLGYLLLLLGAGLVVPALTAIFYAK